jgi:AraC-like DNA-binding protein
MGVRVLAPAADLSPLVRVFVHAEIRDAHTRLLLPEPGVVMALRFGGAAEFVDGPQRLRVANLAVTGLTTMVRTVHATEGGGVILVLFRELGAASLFAAPLHEIHGVAVGLEDLAPRRTVERVQDRLATANSATTRIAVVENFLRELLRRASPDPIVDAAVRAIHARRGDLRIAPLARTLGISQDRLEKRFRRVVGASPKQFASIIRFRRIVAIQRSGVSLTQLAQDTGYYDQSHFVRDFRAVTGTSPTDFFRAPSYCQSINGAQRFRELQSIRRCSLRGGPSSQLDE